MAYASEFRYKRSGHKRNRLSARRRALIIGIAAAAVLVALTLYLQKNVAGILYSISEASVRAMTVAAVNDAVAETAGEAEYSSFVQISYDGEGNILSISANAQRVNLFARRTASVAMGKIAAAAEEGIKVPVGAFTGMEFLAGFGPKVTFKVVSVGSVGCSFSSAFASAGINQTLHSVYLHIEAEVNVVLPSGSERVVTRTEALVAENLIVGSVPEGMFGNIFGDGYRLSA